jgi:hypothetical protein
MLLHAQMLSLLCFHNLSPQIVFEEFGFNSLLAAPAPFFSLHHICNIPVIAQPAPQQPLGIPGVPAAAGSAAGGQAAAIESAEAALATYGAPVRELSAAGVAALTAAKAAGAGVIIDAGGLLMRICDGFLFVCSVCAAGVLRVRVNAQTVMHWQALAHSLPTLLLFA